MTGTLDAQEVLTEYQGVFLNRGCLFVSTVWKFLSGYVNCEVIYPHYDVVNDLVAQLIDPFLDEVEGFLCPSTGDIVLAQYATIQANRAGRKTVAAWADKVEGNAYRVERNGFEQAIRGKKVVILNDRISQGGTTLKVIAEAIRLDCDILGVATLAGVSAASPEMLGVPRVHALSTIDVQAFEFDAVPPKFQGLPVAIDGPLGHGADFQVKYPDYAGGFVRLMAP